MSSRKDQAEKQVRRLRRKRHGRRNVFGTPDRPRLAVFRSLTNIYAQLIDDTKGITVASASTREKDVAGQVSGSSGNVAAAAIVGKALAEKALEAGVTAARFDRNGYKFHGRVKALAEAARAAGLKF